MKCHSIECHNSISLSPKLVCSAYVTHLGTNAVGLVLTRERCSTCIPTKSNMLQYIANYQQCFVYCTDYWSLRRHTDSRNQRSNWRSYLCLARTTEQVSMGSCAYPILVVSRRFSCDGMWNLRWTGGDDIMVHVTSCMTSLLVTVYLVVNSLRTTGSPYRI